MSVSSASLSPSSGTTASQVVGNVVTPPPRSAPTQPSSIVTLSEQGRRLSHSNASAQPDLSQAANTANGVPKEANEAPGIQLIPGGTKNGRISTYA